MKWKLEKLDPEGTSAVKSRGPRINSNIEWKAKNLANYRTPNVSLRKTWLHLSLWNGEKIYISFADNTRSNSLNGDLFNFYYPYSRHFLFKYTPTKWEWWEQRYLPRGRTLPRILQRVRLQFRKIEFRKSYHYFNELSWFLISSIILVLDHKFALCKIARWLDAT